MTIPNLLRTILLTGSLAASSIPTTAEEASATSWPGLITNKTLVAWVYCSNLTQQAGSVLTIQTPAEDFDAVVFGELMPGKWMAGSEQHHRTQRPQAANPNESADARTLVQIVIAYSGKQVTVYRDGQRYAQYEVKEPFVFDDESIVLMGLRHLGSGGPNCFAGAIEEARLYTVALDGPALATLRPSQPGPVPPFAQWTFENGKPEDRMGRFGYAELRGGARIVDGKLLLNGDGAYLITWRTKPGGTFYHSPIHYRPSIGQLGDTIPFFWKGEYHIFYLHGGVGKVPWRHIVSTDLVHWKDLPDALLVDGAPDSFDGGAMFTGCAMEKDGTFHIFYTGHNPRNPLGQESVMHATSPDLIRWTKHPADRVDPDGVFYKKERQRDFRDPFVCWMEPERQYWMVLCANALKGGGPGLYVSKDLKSWTPEPALKAPMQECPDLFKIDDTWYLIGGDTYRWSKDPRDDFKEPAFNNVVDRPFVYAGKRMFDGRRHVWTGWLWDRAPAKDSGKTMWGGTQCLPRELYPGPGGQLYCRPVEEVTAVFTQTVLDLKDKPPLLTQQNRWSYGAGALTGESAGSGSQCLLDVPANYLLQCRLQLDPKAVFTLALREQDGAGSGYRLVLRPETQEAEIVGPTFRHPRRLELNTVRPITLQVFVQGTMFECFINDAYALSFRGYDYKTGKLGLSVTGGKVQLLDLKIKTHEETK